MTSDPHGGRTHRWQEWELADLLHHKQESGLSTSLVVPARNEAATVGDVVTRVREALMETTALLDEMVGTMVNEAVGRRHATVQFATVFLKPVQVGDLVEVTCSVVEATRSMTFVEAKLSVADAAVATATLIFKVRRSAD